MLNVSFPEQFRQMVAKAHPGARFRYAPTPSGLPHIGNAVNFLLNWVAARSIKDGKILLRIDDLDADRKRPEYVEDIFETLAWLGIDYDEGPTDLIDFETRWSQQKRIDLYRNMLDQLVETGEVFACGLSRSDLAAFEGKYPRVLREQGLSLDQPDVAWRVKTPEQLELTDFVVRRKDGIPAYQIASLADDIHFGVSHWIRGADLEPSTQAQMWLIELLGWKDTLRFECLHHPLLMDPQTQQKLSKSTGSTAIRTLRQHGLEAVIVVHIAAAMLNINSDQLTDARQLLNEFRSGSFRGFSLN